MSAQLRSYFERWQRLEADKKAVADDLKELFAEMKGSGFDAKVARKAFRDQDIAENDASAKAEADEFDAIYELYRGELGGPRARSAHVHEENIEEFPPHDATTGDIVEEPDATPAGAVVAERSGATAGETATNFQSVTATIPPVATGPAGRPADESPATVIPMRQPKPLRPHCQRPENCGGYGRTHCGTCLRETGGAA